MMKKLVAYIALCIATVSAYGQQPMARCIDQSRGGIPYIIRSDGYAFQENYPANAGMAMRDPSGQTFMRLPAQSPMTNAFFMGWQGQLIELNVWAPGPMVIGQCFPLMPLPPAPQPVALPTYAYTNGAGVVYGQQVLPVPQPVYNRAYGFSPPPSPRLNDATQCLNQSGGDRSRFMDCLVPKMMTGDQVKAYQCMRTSQDRTSLTTCLAGNMMGGNERRALGQAENCYRQHGTNWDKYSLCMANQNFDPKTVAAVNCVRQQSQNPNASAWAVAGCVAGNALNLNPELTVAVECAMTSGGEPMTFAGCTGGRLTAMELDKCFTQGVGGSGCFGDNNEIVKGLRALGVDMHQIMGPNGFAVQTWNNAVNDLQRGPGPNNEFVKVVNTVNNDLRNGMGKNNDIRKALTKVGLGGLF